MLHLLKTEWLKLYKYPAFWLLMGVCLLTYPGINIITLNIFQELVQKQTAAGQVLSMFLGDPFAFPEVWRTTAYFSSLFVFIPSVLVIMLITNEYSYKTQRQNIIDGWSRRDFMTAKFLDVVLITLLLTGIFALVAFVMGTVQTTEPKSDRWSLFYYAGLFALQSFSQLSLAFLVGLMLRKSFIALAVFLFYAVVAEPISVGLLKYKLKLDYGRFFPMEISDRIIPPPAFWGRIDEDAYKAMLDAVPRHIAYTVVLIILTWIVAYTIYRKRDL
jgi:hypothetical protein